MKKRAVLVAALASAVALSAAGCNRDSADTAKDGEGKIRIEVVAKGYASPFWAAVKKGSEQAGKDLGVEVNFQGPDTETDVPAQNNQLEGVLTKKPNALVFAALDSEAQTTILEKFKADKIPVIAFDSGVANSDIPLTTVSTNNKAAAAEGAKHMVEAVGGKGKVAIICHSQTSVSGTDRRDGFKEYIEQNAPDIQIVDIQYNDSDQAKAETQASAILQAHPDLNGIFATDDDGAVAAANAVGRSGAADVKVIGFDSGKAQIDAIKEGKILGSITQNPYDMGYIAVQKAVDVAKGGSVDKVIDSGFAWYDKTNLDDEKIKKAIYD